VLALSTNASPSPAPTSAPAPTDPLAAEIARWQSFLANHRSPGEQWEDIRRSTEPVLAEAQAALDAGRRDLALQRLASARINLAATEWIDSLPPADFEPAGFTAEVDRVGKALGPDLAAPLPDSLAGIRPAAARALAEAARLQLREYYDASLDFGHSTTARYGLYYAGAARAQRDFIAFTRRLAPGPPKPEPPLRSITVELDALEDAMLAAYHPPAALDRHPDFIAASASLKEARELEAAGLRYGAMYKYLQAAQRLPVPHDPKGAAGKLGAFQKRIADSPTDASIARLYLEIAQADLAAGPGGGAAAAAIADDVLPRYFAALEPAAVPPPRSPRPAPEVTVTLVRWPYT
jgi:hypothetical protein